MNNQLDTNPIGNSLSTQSSLNGMIFHQKNNCTVETQVSVDPV